MDSLNLKDLVAQAIKSEWPAFEQNHPHLAAALDQTILIERAAQTLADDPDYQTAMSNAKAAGLAAETVYDTVADFVKTWVRKLL